VFGIGNMGIGGAERMTVELLKRFDRERFECHLITLLPNPEKNFLDDVPGDVLVHRFAFTSLHDVRSYWRLYRALAKLKPDVVVSNMFFSNTVFRILKPLVGYAAIPCEHNTELYKTRRHIILDRLLAYISYCIVAVSNTVATFTATQEGIPRERFVVIPNGVDIEKMHSALVALPSKEALKQELGFQASDKVLLNVGRLTGQKNHKLLLEGFALFHKSHPDYKLAIVGQGDLRSKLEAQSRELGLDGAVIFFGLRRDVERFYKASDAIMLTSNFEGFAIVGIEAMTCGLPVVSTKTAGPDEYIKEGENGFFIHERTAKAVAQSLELLAAADSEVLRAFASKTAHLYAIDENVERYASLILQSRKY